MKKRKMGKKGTGKKRKEGTKAGKKERKKGRNSSITYFHNFLLKKTQLRLGMGAHACLELMGGKGGEGGAGESERGRGRVKK
jgi:hypothetical protein